ncbi:cytidylate kinase family protein [Rhodococcus koreensis]
MSGTCISGTRRNIAISGLTAAGKTTHAKLLAAQLGYDYISATAKLLELAGYKGQDVDRVWFSQLSSINEMRKSDTLDDLLEAHLTELAESRDGLVLDTWAVPWISNADMVRVWIESDRLSRTWKCFVSQGAQPRLDLVECTNLIDEKDRTTRDIFLRRHGFDLFRDRTIFDVVLDNTQMIEAPTRASCDRGIGEFATVVSSAIESAIHCDSRKNLDGSIGWTDVQKTAVIRIRKE